MPSFRLKNLTDIEDFVRGVTYFGTGGGGRPEDGIAHLSRCLEDGYALSWTDPHEIPDDSWCCTVFGMGSIAPVAASTEAPYGLKDKKILRPMVRALELLAEFTGKNIHAVAAFELGGANSPKAFDAGIRYGALVPDGDFCGRAVPELSQTTAAIAGVAATPMVICDDWGNELIMTAAATTESAEGIGKMISIITKAPDPKATCAHAGFMVTGKMLKRLICPGTFSLSYHVGKAIREALDAKDHPAAAAATAGGGEIIFSGTVQAVDWVNEKGYMIGTTFIQGNGPYADRQMSVWFQNENHLAKIDSTPVAMSPDMIHIVSTTSGEPHTNTRLTAGMDVTVIATPNPRYRSSEGLAALGPEHFHIDLPYMPFETK
jgi:uncharacterized protein